MTRPTGRTIFTVMLALIAAAGVEAASAGEWTEPVEVLHEHKRCISYRARLNGEYLVVQAAIEPGWHTFVMDNKQRSAEKLAGRQSLGVDGPTEFALTQGLEVAGPWYQSEPKDFSKPELRWYSWGYEGEARFVAKVRRLGPGPAQIAVRGQACTETICKNIEVEISLPIEAAAAQPSSIDRKGLVEVRAAK